MDSNVFFDHDLDNHGADNESTSSKMQYWELSSTVFKSPLDFKKVAIKEVVVTIPIDYHVPFYLIEKGTSNNFLKRLSYVPARRKY